MIQVITSYFERTLYPLLLVFFIWILISNKKDKRAKYMLVTLTIYSIFFPLAYYGCVRFNFTGEVYRLLWALPLSMIMAYVMIYLWKKRQEGLATLLVMLLVAVFFLGNEGIVSNKWKWPENIYEIPDQVINITDVILEDGEEEYVTVLGNVDYMLEARQYSNRIRWGISDRIYIMEEFEQNIDNPYVMLGLAVYYDEINENYNYLETLRQLNIGYLVLYPDNALLSVLSEDSYVIIDTENGVNIYKMEYESTT